MATDPTFTMPALYYAVRRKHNQLTVMRVESEVDDLAHGYDFFHKSYAYTKQANLVGKFPNESMARLALVGMLKVKAKYKDEIEKARDDLLNAERAQKAAVENYVASVVTHNEC